MGVDTKRSFGGGLEAVLGAASIRVEDAESNANSQELKQLMVHQIVPGRFQPRRHFDKSALQELSDSIAAQGILQPIVVRQIAQNEYEIIAGERRWRAAQMAALQQVPCIICNISDESALAFGLIENIQRQDLNPIEEASALKRLLEEFNMTHEEVAKSVGRSRALVTNMLRLLNLTQSVQDMLIAKEIDIGHARVLLVFSPEEQLSMANTIVAKKMSVRAAEKFAQAKRQGKSYNDKPAAQHPNCGSWSTELSKKLSSKVRVSLPEAGSGKIVIHVDSADEVEWLIESL